MEKVLEKYVIDEYSGKNSMNLTPIVRNRKEAWAGS